MISHSTDSICYATRINSIEDADHICNGVKPQLFVFVYTEHLKCLTKIFDRAKHRVCNCHFSGT